MSDTGVRKQILRELIFQHPKFKPLYVLYDGRDLHVLDLRTMNRKLLSYTHAEYVLRDAMFADQPSSAFAQHMTGHKPLILNINAYREARRALIDGACNASNEPCNFDEFIRYMYDKFSAFEDQIKIALLTALTSRWFTIADMPCIVDLRTWLLAVHIQDNLKLVLGAAHGERGNIQKLFDYYYVNYAIVHGEMSGEFISAAGRISKYDLFDIIDKHENPNPEIYKFIAGHIGAIQDQDREIYLKKMHVEHATNPQLLACLPSKFECYICLQQNDEPGIIRNICACKLTVHYYCVLQMIQPLGPAARCPTCRANICVDWYGAIPYFSQYDIYPSNSVRLVNSEVLYFAIKCGAVHAINKFFIERNVNRQFLNYLVENLCDDRILRMTSSKEKIRAMYAEYSDVEIAELSGLYLGIQDITHLWYTDNTPLPYVTQCQVMRILRDRLRTFGIASRYFYHTRA
jgi:hypothetical protein